MPEWMLPLATVPRVMVAGQFLLRDRDFSVVHKGPTHALHLHGYDADMTLGGARIRLAPGSLTLSPAGQASTFHLEQPARHWCIHFLTDAAAGPVAPVALHLTGCGHLREQFARVSWLHATASDDIGRSAARVLTQDLLLTAARLSRPAQPDDAAIRAAQYIDTHFAEPIDLKTIAAAVGRSDVHLARLFRKRFGISVFRRLLQRRAEHARFLLESTDLPIWLVSERCGVPDAQHFNKFMRKMFGCSPSALRASAGRAIIDPDR